MSLPLTRARRARIEPRASYVAMASLTSYFKTVTATEHLATAFSPREPGQKTVKRPVGRPRKRRAEDEIPVETASVSVGNGNWQYSDSILVARVVFLVLGSELITEVRVP